MRRDPNGRPDLTGEYPAIPSPPGLPSAPAKEEELEPWDGRRVWTAAGALGVVVAIGVVAWLVVRWLGAR